jgi:hypothetical protein
MLTPYKINKLNKTKPLKPKVYEDKSVTDLDRMAIDENILDFVSDGLQFDRQVIETTAAHTLPYNPAYVAEIFQNKHSLGGDVHLEPNKYKLKYMNIARGRRPDKTKPPPRNPYNEMVLYEDLESAELVSVPPAPTKFKARPNFEDAFLSVSDGELTEAAIQRARQHMSTAKSLDDMHVGGGFFLTETPQTGRLKSSRTTSSKQSAKKRQSSKAAKKRAAARDELKVINNTDWDEFLINSLSENTARWIVMKTISERNLLFSL